MKKIVFIFLTVISFSLFGQTSGRVYNFNVKPGHDKEVLKLFNEFNMDSPWKEGSGIMLQAVSFKNHVTHRILVWGNPENMGRVNPKTNTEWDAYRDRMSLHRTRSIDNAMITSHGFTEGDIKANPTAKIFDLHVSNPTKFKAAFDKLIKESKSILGNRRIGLIRYDAGGTPGATHGIVVYGKNMNDLVILERKFRASKAFPEYLKNRGEVVYKQNYIVNTLSRF